MKAIMHPGVSLDGFIAKLNGDSDSWLNPEDQTRFERAVEGYGCMIVGHKTFKQFEKDFSTWEDVTVFVCTNQSGHGDEDHVKFISGTPAEMLENVAAKGFSGIIVCGGGEINGLFASAGLVDEIIISVQPVVLGEGIPLFGSYKPDLKLELLSSNEDIKSVIQNHYKVLKLDNNR